MWMDERGRWVNEVCVFGEMALSLEEGGGGVCVRAFGRNPSKGFR